MTFFVKLNSTKKKKSFDFFKKIKKKRAIPTKESLSQPTTKKPTIIIFCIFYRLPYLLLLLNREVNYTIQKMFCLYTKNV